MKTSRLVSLVIVAVVISFAAGAMFGPQIVARFVPSAVAQSKEPKRVGDAVMPYPLGGKDGTILGFCIKGVEYLMSPSGAITPRIDPGTDKPAHCNF